MHFNAFQCILLSCDRLSALLRDVPHKHPDQVASREATSKDDQFDCAKSSCSADCDVDVEHCGTPRNTVEPRSTQNILMFKKAS